MPTFRRWLSRLLVLSIALIVLTLIIAFWLLRGSLPQLEGEIALPGQTAPASIERDALGTVTVTAGDEVEMARALGYAHAQERFFEMDLLRRSAAGELSELFGKIALERDKQIRMHRLRARVEADFAAFTSGKEAVLKAYTDGVNAGLADLQVRPWPYLLLRTAPQPWKPSDSAMVGYAMFIDLQDEMNSRELALWRIRESVPPALYALIAADGTEWDAPLQGEPRGNVPLPSADLIDLRALPAPDRDMEHKLSEPAAPGSNNFAVSGALTQDGRAIVADDMHLGLRAPNIWFRARLKYPDARAPGGKVDVSGFSLPGIPAIVVGSNGHVAWGFTNSYGDWADWVRVRPADVREVEERIAVKGEPTVSYVVRDTAQGPVMHELDDGSLLAMDWVAQHPGALNLRLSDLAISADLDAALALVDGAGIPAQNFVVGDSKGGIAWLLSGKPRVRSASCDYRAPVLRECLDETASPPQRPLARKQDRLWTANARTLDGEELRIVGDAGYANGARAKQIRDGLYAKQRFTEKDLLAIQLDDRAIFLERWWKRMRDIAATSPSPAMSQLSEASTSWEGRASESSVSYRLTRAWRLAVIERIKAGLTAPAMVRLGEAFVMPDLPQIEGVAWQLVSQEPAHLLPKKFTTWQALYEDAALQVLDALKDKGPLAERSWGERNTARICHPLANALPAFSHRWLCMPKDALRGDGNMPLVAAPDFGASQRMVVSPGHEADGIIHMPGGQSGHPLSPFWGAGHQAWVKGEATPFLPGESVYRIEIKP